MRFNNYTLEQIEAANESAKRYLMTFVSRYDINNLHTRECLILKHVGIDSSKRGSLEPFYLLWRSDAKVKYKFPVYLSYANLTRLLERSGPVFGRTEWGPWVMIYTYEYQITSIWRVDGDQGSLKKFEKYYKAEFEGE